MARLQIKEDLPLQRREKEFTAKLIIKYLGVQIDNKPNWIEHINYVCRKGRALAFKLGTSAKLSWGFNSNSLKIIYEGLLQPGIMQRKHGLNR